MLCFWVVPCALGWFVCFVVEGLLFTSVCDALGKELKQGYSLIIVVLIAAIAVYYEGRIIHILKQNNKR